MENIFDFKQFKNSRKINEASEAPLAKRADIGGYGGGSGTDTYFANVKYNFAGAENTLIGSMVMKIFGFFKRKINEGILFVYKKALFREYLANVLRYANKNGITYQSENTLFEVQQIKNAEGTAVETEVIKVKFISVKKDEKKKTMTPYEVGAKVMTEQNKVAEDGTYNNISETSQFEVKAGVITSITPITLPEPTEEAAEEEKEEEKEQPKEEVNQDWENIGDDVKGIAEEVKKILANINSISTEELANYLVELRKILDNIRLSGIFEIDQLLKNKNLSATHREELQKDRKVYVDEQTLLNSLHKSIEGAIRKKKMAKTPTATATGTPATGTPPKTTTKAPVNSVSASAEYEYDETLNEEFKISKGMSFRGVKLGGVDKKLSDEVGNLDLKILEDENFAKQFEPKEVKDGVTALIKENSQPIQKIQLAAERIYKMGAATEATAKLENTWQRMVKDDLALFSRYMNTEEVSPFVLVQGASTQTKQEAEKLGKSTEQTGKDSLVDDNSILKLKKGFATGVKSYGIMSTSSNYFIYQQDQVKINGLTYWAYKILGIVDWEKFQKVTEAGQIAACINWDKNTLAGKLKFQPLERSNTTPNFDGEFQSAYIINSSPTKHLKTIANSTNPVPNDVNMLGLYVKKENAPMVEKAFIKDNYLKTFFLTFRNKTDEKSMVLRDPSANLKATEYSVGVRYVWQITDATAADYVVPEEDKKPTTDSLSNIEQMSNLRPKPKKTT